MLTLVSRARGRCGDLARRRGAQLALGTGASVLGMGGSAFALDPTSAEDVDYSTATDGITAGIAHAIPYALTAMGVIAAFSLGIGIFRRITGAKKAPSA